MPFARSLFAAKQPNNNRSSATPKTSNGWTWLSRNMNETSPNSSFSIRPTFPPLSILTNMSLSEQPKKQLPRPVSSESSSLSPGQGLSDKTFRRFHHHNLSDSTAASASSDSSPTTTISNVDDSSATDPSPGSSPESPPPPATFAAGMLRPRTSDDSRTQFFELQKNPLPRKGRNLKNLAVNTSRHPARAASTNSLPLTTGTPDSLPTILSPSFMKPPSPPKRKQSSLGLTLLTPGSSKTPPQEIKLAIPPTPAYGRPGTLRHFQSSPSLPLIPALGLQTDVAIRAPRNINPLDTIFSPTNGATEAREEEEEEQNFDVPLSKEEKPEAYPDGPICIYGPYVDLYLEPSAAQARNYDVILNVASEVRNPFLEHSGPVTQDSEIRIDGGGGIQYAPRRDGQLQPTTTSKHEQDNSPTTPKATPASSPLPEDAVSASDKEPEYIHIKWEHNSDIVPDLLRLVKLIDEKAMQGKRVLVHCQCGVSRSASLVVAYGLYKNPTLSVQEAYDIVKKRSKWIGPNMNLIMQLQEFRTSLMHGGVLSSNRGLSPNTPSSSVSEWGGPFSMRSSDRATPPSQLPRPLLKTHTAESLPLLSPSTSANPSSLIWQLKNSAPGQRARALSAAKTGTTAYVNPSGKVVPVVPILKVVEPESAESSPAITQQPQPHFRADESDSATPTEPTISAQSEEFAMTPLQPSPEVAPEDTFGLMSPSSTEFAISPFDRSTLLAQLGMGPIRQQEEAPRRASSTRSRAKAKDHDTPATLNSGSLTPQHRNPKVRGKMSSPSLREQRELQDLQARIQASLPHRPAGFAAAVGAGGIDEALMSPRATEFTQNPFALSLAPAEAGKEGEGEKEAPPSTPRSPDADPRSPPLKSGSPITRNILDVL